MLLSTVSAVQICGVRRLQISFVSATNTMLLCSVQIDGNLISQTRSHARPSCRSAAHSNLIRIIAWTNNLQYDLYHATLLHSMCVCVCHRAREYKKKNRQIKRPIKLQYHLYNDIETIDTVDQWLLALAGRNMPQKYGASVQNITNNKIMHLWLSTFSISLVFFFAVFVDFRHDVSIYRTKWNIHKEKNMFEKMTYERKNIHSECKRIGMLGRRR